MGALFSVCRSQSKRAPGRVALIDATKESIAELHRWCLQTGVPKDKIVKHVHATIGMSTVPIDEKAYASADAIRELKVSSSEMKLALFEGKDAFHLVIKFDSPEMTKRNGEFFKAGAVARPAANGTVYDYVPHVTLAFALPNSERSKFEHSLEQLSRTLPSLVFGPERLDQLQSAGEFAKTSGI